MPQIRTYDDVDTLFKLNADGESCATICVLGEAAYKKAVAEGWTDITRLPKLPFPTVVYRPTGETKEVNNRAELDEAMAPCGENCLETCRAHRWERKVYAVPQPKPEAPAVSQIATSDKATVELALELVKANTRAAEQDQAISELRELQAETLKSLKALQKKLKIEAE